MICENCFHERIAQNRVLFALSAQAFRVHGDGMHGVERGGIQGPFVGRKKPGPPQDVSRMKGLELNRTTMGYMDFDRDRSLPDEIEMVRGLSFFQDEFSRLDDLIRAAAGEKLDVILMKILEKGMVLENFRDVFDRHFELPRMAEISSVKSMPTGHQAMQRPHPTQPDVPNWSIQLATLCVSHWRYLDLVLLRITPP